MTPNSQVVSLRNIVSQHHARVLADARKHGQQSVALERLRFIDNHEGIVQRTPTDVCQRQDLENSTIDDVVDYLFRNQRAKGVKNCLTPRIHLLGLGARQVSEFLTANCE